MSQFLDAMNQELREAGRAACLIMLKILQMMFTVGFLGMLFLGVIGYGDRTSWTLCAFFLCGVYAVRALRRLAWRF